MKKNKNITEKEKEKDVALIDCLPKIFWQITRNFLKSR